MASLDMRVKKNSFSHVLHRGSDISAPLFADNDDHI